MSIKVAGVLRTATPFAEDAVEQLQVEMEINVYRLIYVAFRSANDACFRGAKTDLRQ